MIISGFLMTYIWQSREYGDSVNLRSSFTFWMKRFFRIAPVYYVLLIFTFAIAGAYCHGFAILEQFSPFSWLKAYDPARMLRGFTAKNFLPHATFVFGFIPRYASSTFMPDWSIGLEMQFYAVFPGLLILFRRFGYVWPSVAALALTVPAWQMWRGIEPSFLLLKLPTFFIGMIVAEACRRYDRDKKDATALVIIALLLAARNPTGSPEERAVLPLIPAVIFGLMCLRDSRIPGFILIALNRLLDNGLMRFMADMSYSVYLLHTFFCL
jgi:peptidoglycan/LPS O-acetylase OafA/YrhL